MGFADALFGPRRDDPRVVEYQRVADEVANGDADGSDLERAGRGLAPITTQQLDREAGL